MRIKTEPRQLKDIMFGSTTISQNEHRSKCSTKSEQIRAPYANEIDASLALRDFSLVKNTNGPHEAQAHCN